MPPPANLSITPPDPPPLSSEPSETDVEDPTTPKASQPPQLNLIPDSPTSSMPPPSMIPSRVNAKAMLGLSISTLPPQQRPRQKVVLAPGFSPLDWARLKSSGTDLRVPRPELRRTDLQKTETPYLLRIPPSELKRHRRRNDAWIAINGKVYNVTAYLPFHPGGEKELMRGVGRDGTNLFRIFPAPWSALMVVEFHAWVNAETMLDKCLIGFLVPEPKDED